MPEAKHELSWQAMQAEFRHLVQRELQDTQFRSMPLLASHHASTWNSMVIPSVHPWDRLQWLHGTALTPETAQPNCSAQHRVLLLPHAQTGSPALCTPAKSAPHEHICAHTTSHCSQHKANTAEEGELQPPRLPG